MRAGPLLLILGHLGCVVARRSVVMPPNDVTTIALFSGTLPHPMDGIARHPWFAVRRAGENEWKIYEVGGGGTSEDPARNSPYGNTLLHGLWRGEEAERAAPCIESMGPEVKDQIQRDYVFYPGPNSNTFGDVVLRRCKLAAMGASRSTPAAPKMARRSSGDFSMPSASTSRA